MADPQSEPHPFEKRLNGQKNLLVKLRDRVTALETEVAELRALVVSGNPVSASPANPVSAAGPVTPTPVKAGVWWEMKPHCLTCGQRKEPGRETNLSCKKCGSEYNAMVKGLMPKKPKTTCGYCGATKPASLNPQCAKCQGGFREWKARP